MTIKTASSISSRIGAVLITTAILAGCDRMASLRASGPLKKPLRGEGLAVKGCLDDRFATLQPSAFPKVQIDLSRVTYADPAENQWTYTKRMCTSFWSYWQPLLPPGTTQVECQQKQAEFLSQHKMGQAVGTNPHPVYFRANIQSTNPIVEYYWDFGDPAGNLPNTSIAPEAAHLYENPGVYTATIRVVDQAGNEARDQVTVTVVNRNSLGRKYYVDPVTGADTNDGLSPTSAWKTADYAFRNALLNRPAAIPPHSQILFRRGQEYSTDSCNAGLISQHSSGMVGRYFGAYGTGANPLIRASNTQHACQILQIWGWDHGHITFEDIDFDLQSPQGYRSSFIGLWGNTVNIVFNRVTAKRVFSGLIVGETTDTINGKIVPYPSEGVYFIQSRIFDSDIYRLTRDPAHERDGVMMGGAGEKWGVIDSVLEESGNHLLYLYAKHVVVDYLKGIKQSFGRASIRGRAERPGMSGYYNVTNSEFHGWIDPIPRQNGGGRDYNYSSVEFTPSGPNDEIVENVFFARNKVTNAMTLLRIGNADRISICDNQFETLDSSWAPMVEFGNSNIPYQNRANSNVRLFGNRFVQLSPNRDGDFIFINNIKNNPFPGPSQFHENFEVLANRFVILSGFKGSWMEMNRSQPNGLPDMTKDEAEAYWKREFLIKNNTVQISTPATKLIGTGGGDHYTVEQAQSVGLIHSSNKTSP